MIWKFFVNVLALVIILQTQRPLSAASVKDAESATHGTSASEYQTILTYKFPGVKIIQFELGVLSHYSYMVISDKDALVVDPGRDVQVYLDTAGKEGAIIKGVFLTHSHADFVAGHMELAKRLGCPIYQSKDSGAKYKFFPLSDGQEITLGSIKIRFIATPGHTPDGVCAVVYGKDDNMTPKAIFTGDTLFVGSIGRPDLMGKNMPAAVLAEMSYDSWHNKLSRLDDNVIVLPAHGAGSLCGAHLSDEPSSTIGQERKNNSYLQNKGKSVFVTAVLSDLPEAPQYFQYNAKMNREGPPLVDWGAKLPKVKYIDSSLSDTSKYYVIDLRNAKDFADGHIPNSVNIGLRGRLETWTGIMVPWGSKVVLCGSEKEIQEAQHRLNRIGYTPVACITPEEWKNANQPVLSNKKIKPVDIYHRMLAQTAPIIVDVRLPKEWMGVRIGEVLNFPLNNLSSLASKLDPNEEVITVCNSAYRSSMGIGILERLGFNNVSSMEGGGEAWIESGLPTESIGAGKIEAKQHVRLPDIITPASLKEMLMDMPDAFEIIDIRPQQYFDDYSLPGSINMDIGNIINDPSILNGKIPLVIVDRNGTIALIVAGILSEKTDRPIKVLAGGLTSYWELIDMNQPVKAVPLPTSKPPVSPSINKPPQQKPSPPKRKSAGC